MSNRNGNSGWDSSLLLIAEDRLAGQELEAGCHAAGLIVTRAGENFTTSESGMRQQRLELT
jgi:hypothetical protein